MSAEANTAILRRFFEEVVNKKNLAPVDQFFSPDFVDHIPIPHAPGSEGLKQFGAAIFNAFPDFNLTVEDTIAEGDKVVARVTNRGTQKGEFLGIAPSGKQAVWGAIWIVRIVGGRVVERWVEFDLLGLMRQLGAVPGPK